MASNTPATLTPKMRQAALLDANGATIAEISMELAVSERTVSRWRARPEYQEAVDEVGRQLFRDGLRKLRSAAPLAAAEIERLISEAKSDPTRLAAARTVFDIVGRVDIEAALSEMDNRLSTLEHPHASVDVVGFYHGGNGGAAAHEHEHDDE